ncbi:deoxynucleoside kinase [Sphingomonas nostoxanthinifaciens]|uniref:deoxynucleoside kinase n=1 Tax=Sphingomonas nostoxanthinifaciens TaxID=2872652 RepID=UPI001CC2013D|nr:deoxynucleoside kinase [Sphingomonas nostoxanthinifaciens]UAK25963.1 deoxynucleoside kinase [Sphingomonas nostoxanthinifaciens]
MRNGDRIDLKRIGAAEPAQADCFAGLHLRYLLDLVAAVLTAGTARRSPLGQGFRAIGLAEAVSSLYRPAVERIEFCGGIGAGKSTCAALLAERWSLPLVGERFESIPYWQLYYQDPARYALEKDLSFLLSHVDTLRAAAAPNLVCDFALFQTVAYSAIVGDAADTAAVDAVYRQMTVRLGQPALVILLRCDTSIQLDRIRKRGRAPEQKITADYLQRLDRAIDEQIDKLPNTVSVIEWDTSRGSPSRLLEQPAIQAVIDRWSDARSFSDII